MQKAGRERHDDIRGLVEYRRKPRFDSGNPRSHSQGKDQRFGSKTHAYLRKSSRVSMRNLMPRKKKSQLCRMKRQSWTVLWVGRVKTLGSN